MGLCCLATSVPIHLSFFGSQLFQQFGSIFSFAPHYFLFIGLTSVTVSLLSYFKLALVLVRLGGLPVRMVRRVHWDYENTYHDYISKALHEYIPSDKLKIIWTHGDDTHTWRPQWKDLLLATNVDARKRPEGTLPPKTFHQKINFRIVLLWTFVAFAAFVSTFSYSRPPPSSPYTPPSRKEMLSSWRFWCFDLCLAFYIFDLQFLL